ncbi:MAG: thermonuclease family protein [Thermodesulfovibrionia bacterium]|nr:thermonuclease family protein [Thermodesulfovibrionia bacterium]
MIRNILYLFISSVISVELFFAHPLQSMEIFSPPSSHSPENSLCDFQTVSKVIDGDTFELSDSTRIRLIGVDTPETVDSRTEIMWFGKEASKKMREWIAGETVCLKRDRDKTQDTDKYGRLLRYVWKYTDSKKTTEHTEISEGFFVNAEIIRQGYGFAYTRYPFRYLEDFRKYEKDARENNRGLWNRGKYKIWKKEIEENKLLAETCGQSETVCPEDALRYTGQLKTVRFFVKKSYDSGKAVFLNSKNNFKDHDNFTAVIFETDRNKFPPNAADIYMGKTIDVRGHIKNYKGRAEIILSTKSQIEIIMSYPR